MPSNPNIPSYNNDDEEAEILNARIENFGSRGKKVNEIVGQQLQAESQAQIEPQPEEQPDQSEPQPEAQPTQPENPNIEELSVDQLLELDVSKLSRDELIYMQVKLRQEREALEAGLQGSESVQNADENVGGEQIENTDNTELEGETAGDKALEDYRENIESVPQPSAVVADEIADELPDGEDQPDDSEDIELDDADLESASDAEIAEAAEHLTPEEATAAYEKHKNKPKSKNFFKKLFAAIGIAAILASAGGLFLNNANMDTNADVDAHPKDKSEQQQEAEKIGIIDGYNEAGMWASENKPSDVAFASAVELGKIHDGDAIEITKDVANNQVESFGDYLANIPDSVKDHYGMNNWDDMSILETVNELEGASDSRYESVQSGFNHIMDQAQYRVVTLDGEYDNAYMKLKDPNGPLTHENMELVKCTTVENGTKAVEMYWTDDGGNELGSMIVKIAYDDDGNVVDGCTQVVNKIGSKAYTGMTTIEHDRDNPSQPSNPDTGEENTGTGDEGTGDKDTGNEDTGTGDEGTETGEENTGTGDEGTDIQPKDPDNLQRIDDQINDDIADDINTDEVKVTPTEKVSDDDKTDAPSSDSYEGTEASTTQNDTSKDATPVQHDTSPSNDYSHDNGGSNSSNSAPKPVQSNSSGQSQADHSSTPVDKAPTEKSDVADTMKDLEE